MRIFRWLKLFILEQRLNFGAFGKYNRYRCWCLEQNATTAAEKLRIAHDVLKGPGVSLTEAQHNEDCIRKMKASRDEAGQPMNSQLRQQKDQGQQTRSAN